MAFTDDQVYQVLIALGASADDYNGLQTYLQSRVDSPPFDGWEAKVVALLTELETTKTALDTARSNNQGKESIEVVGEFRVRFGDNAIAGQQAAYNAKLTELQLLIGQWGFSTQPRVERA